MPCASAQSIVASMASWPVASWIPAGWSIQRTRSVLGGTKASSPTPAPSSRATKVSMTGRSYLRAKSRSRWSCAGQPKMAPVPYSISTKFATQTGSVPPSGFATVSPVS